jgi:hypothetical protein
MPITIHQEVIESENRIEYTIIEMIPDLKMLRVPAYRVEKRYMEEFKKLAPNHVAVDYDPTYNADIYVHKRLAFLAKLNVVYRERIYMGIVFRLYDWNLLDWEINCCRSLRKNFRPWRFRKIRNDRKRLRG